MHLSMVATALTLPGYRITRNLAIVCGITIRSRFIVGNFLGGIQSLFGANGIIGMRYDAKELMEGLTEVLCCGTAVYVEPFDVVLSPG
jgi:uncharacterized protein YbjQ (UPF0145 family)